MDLDIDDEPEQPAQSFVRRYRIAIIVTGVVLGGIVVVAKLASGSAVPKRDLITLVSLSPPPPPPPLPRPPPPPQQEEQKMDQPMIKEEEPKEAPKNEPLSTGIKGDGPNSFGLSDKPGNGSIGGNGGRGTKWAWYAKQVQSRVQQALQRNGKTRSASIGVNVRVWPDANGRIHRAQLASSTGDPRLDAAIRDEVLTGLQLDQPPPMDMPAPITLHLAARRP